MHTETWKGPGHASQRPRCRQQQWHPHQRSNHRVWNNPPGGEARQRPERETKHRTSITQWETRRKEPGQPWIKDRKLRDLIQRLLSSTPHSDRYHPTGHSSACTTKKKMMCLFCGSKQMSIGLHCPILGWKDTDLWVLFTNVQLLGLSEWGVDSNKGWGNPFLNSPICCRRYIPLDKAGVYVLKRNGWNRQVRRTL